MSFDYTKSQSARRSYDVKGSISEHVQEALNKHGPKQRKFFWAEVAKHDSPNDCWVVVHGNVYDLTDFINIHPGGFDVLNGAGGDVTELFEYSHPLRLTKIGPPKSLMIGQIRDYKPMNNFDGKMYNELKEEMEKTIPREIQRYDKFMYWKAFVLSSLYFICFYRWIKYSRIIDLIIYMFVAGQAAINIMHDGCHFAFSEDINLNWLAGLAMEMVCSSSLYWSRSHNIAHHPYTQHYEREMHFINQDSVRLHYKQPRMWYHKYQQYYIWPAMSIYGFNDYVYTFDNLPWLYNFPYRKGYINPVYLFGHGLVMLNMIVNGFGTQCYIHGFLWTYPVFMTMVFGIGHSFMWFINVNHWNILNAHTCDEDVMDENWAIQTYRNCTNFGCENSIYVHFTGGLNMHKEHHLFPSYAHSNFMQMKPLIKKWGEKHGMPYHYFKTLFGALWGHYKYLEGLGKYDKPPPYKWNQEKQCLEE